MAFSAPAFGHTPIPPRSLHPASALGDPEALAEATLTAPAGPATLLLVGSWHVAAPHAAGTVATVPLVALDGVTSVPQPDVAFTVAEDADASVPLTLLAHVPASVEAVVVAFDSGGTLLPAAAVSGVWIGG